MPDLSEKTQQLFLFGSSHRTAPLEVRERFAIPDESMADLYRELKTNADVAECMVLNTCNRVEIYGVAPNGFDEEKIYNLLEERHGIPAKQLAKFSFSLCDEEVVRHAFEVAAGIDSQMLGETEILGQVKASYATASELSATGPILNRLFQKSFQAAKWARTNTALGQGLVSIGNIAVDLAERVCGDLSNINLLLIGTGEAGQKTAQALVSRGVEQLTVISRNHERAYAIADEFGAASGATRDLDKFLPHTDVVIGSTTTEEPLITRKRLKPILRQRPSRPYFFIDLGVPRNIDPGVAKLNNTYLYGLDDLSDIANENMKSRMQEVERAKAGLAERAKLLWERLA
ncbi:glutamyl-tRNA reductase [Rubellicoccus peritrichatus]|uniref:Glutamyl-tRNA reductase n=1 Tax=Rubellicoccus peritrichatus TaxID=3080537 RepID=A0AAQ3QPP5_9BACT|nr:glutamyl-tRNA reductase [Puniceicoccus sp. CR14]WOO39278.1 glutamyl-tRNA reductase [Puniceicoccus sp. CR14]